MSDTIQIIDTHQHLWDLSRHRYSWTAGSEKLNRSFTPGDYSDAAAALPSKVRLIGAVHVEADVDEPDMAAETDWVLSMCADPAMPTTAAVACCRPERSPAEFAKFLDRFTGNKHLKGVRRVLHTQPDELSQQAGFRENVRSLAGRGLSFDLCVLPRQLPIGTELAAECENVSFILDHCGVPDVKGKALDPWRDHLRALAKLPNVVACKISGLVAYADAEKWTPEDLRPFVDHAVECFGHDRVIFGSDWPVCTLSAPYAGWVSAILKLTADWSADDRAKLFRANAERVYRLTEAHS
jgi:predicted TIM-barrel fold metal-dependent hydrolase